jgi:hypothetical protein
MPDEPRLEIIKLPDLLGDEWRAERVRLSNEARDRYHDRLVATLTSMDHSSAGDTAVADAILDALFLVTRIENGDACACSCHPHLPTSDLHDFGFDCPCQQTAAERTERFNAWMADMDEFWDSPEGRAITEEDAQQEAALRAWLDANPDVTVLSHGGLAPEQWYGAVDGRSFYFRERHDRWRIELDLHPSGRFYRAWVAGELDDDTSFEDREIEEGEIVAQGTTANDGYGATPVDRVRFITDAIRAHLRRQDCDVHRHELDDLELLCGRPLNWCPACGLRLYDTEPAAW